MGMIHVLPESIANKIAAGEVIERPASIVKELVENSLDGGASCVDVVIQHGGRSLIRVADNGCGMSREDAELAFQRHATSKISSAEDLDRIVSYGFRGEALASIAAVARVKMLTRAQGEAAGIEITVEGGKINSIREAPCRVGTIVEVKDLFFNTPARRKFMKGNSTETGHVMQTFGHFAIAMPQVSFSLKSNDNLIFELTPVKEPLERAQTVLEEDPKQLIALQGEGTGIKVSGFIGKPAAARSNRSGQTFFVNRRWVKSIALGFAMQDGYHGLLMHGQFPVAALFIEVNPEQVDVNVHPTKQEVRLSHENEIKSLIRRTVTESLQKDPELAPALKLSGATSHFQSMGEPARGIKQAYQPLDFLRKASAESEALKVADSGEALSCKTSETPVPAMESITLRDKTRVTKVLGQIHQTFIVAESDEGMLIMDQHAAHERVMFEGLLQDIQSGSRKKQGLLMEEIFKVHPKDRELLCDSIPLLEKIGFEIEPFGENDFVIRAYPAVLEGHDPLASLKAFIEEKSEGKLKTSLDHHGEEIAALIACKKSSVKAHEAMTPPAMISLVERLFHCENPFHCPHGRPVFFKLTFFDLEKQFKRK